MYLNVRCEVGYVKTVPDESGPGINGNGRVLHATRSSRTGASPKCVVFCPTQDNLFFVGGGVITLKKI